MNKDKDKCSVVTGDFNAKVMTRNDGETPIGLSEVGTKTGEIGMIRLRKETHLASLTHVQNKNKQEIKLERLMKRRKMNWTCLCAGNPDVKNCSNVKETRIQ